MISFKNITKIYSNHTQTVALDNVNLEIQEKEFMSLVGKSGAGKSTLMRILIGEEKPTKGRVFFDKIEVNKLAASKLPVLRQKIGMVFQDFKLLPHKTAYENIAFALEATSSSDREIKKAVPEILDLVGLKSRAYNFPAELSAGEKQRVAIARALIHRPNVIIADEPTGNLDPLNSWEIIKLLIKINELGTTVILTTHNKDIINSIGKRVVSMDAGRIMRDDPEGRYVLV